MEDLNKYIARLVKEVDAALGAALPAANARPKLLHQAMRYSLFAGGKRLRPILCLAAAEACGSKPQIALPAACALECIHTYSLIHDDLPCMDDDDLRRGKPTSHKKFGEATAVLAGDALLTEAFSIIAQMQPTRRYAAGDFVKMLASAAGSRGMIAGQVEDMQGEGKSYSGKELRRLHEGKTGALIAASLRLGAMAADATPSTCDALADFGLKLGLAFQVIDDILDVTQSSEHLGKSAGKDARSGKSTYPAAIGLAASQRKAAQLTAAAMQSLATSGVSDLRLREIAYELLNRNK